MIEENENIINILFHSCAIEIEERLAATRY
jgi:hypothetical protein